MALVAVGSRNPVKLRAVARAFERMLPPVTAAVRGVSVSVQVPDQPVGDLQTLRGARQRAAAAKACVPEAEFCVGLEGGVAEVGDRLAAFAWAVVSGDAAEGLGRTATFIVPPAVAALVRDGLELGDADDRVFGCSNSKRGLGAVGILTHGLVDRAAFCEQAVVMALIPFTNRPLYDA